MLPTDCGRPLGLCLSPSARISLLYIPKTMDGREKTRSLHGPYVSADYKLLKPLLGPLLWNWKQEPVTAAAIASFGWVCVWGSVRKAQSDGSAHADLLTATGCRRLTSCCHTASSSLSWPPSVDVCLPLSVSSLQMCLHVCVVTKSLIWADKSLRVVHFWCWNILIIWKQNWLDCTQTVLFPGYKWRLTRCKIALHVLKTCI